MDKEEEVKNVDFKVTANCCDGCKRKIIKALSIKGVLKTEIHPSLPKITVTGNFDTRVILKKLAKVGKTAEIILPRETHKAEKKKSEDSKETEEKERKPKVEKPFENKSKSDDSNETEGTKNTEKGEGKSKKNKEEENKDGSNDALFPTIATAIPNYTMNSSIVNSTMPTIPNYTMNSSIVNSTMPPVYYNMEPVMVPVTHYSMNNNPYSMSIPYGYGENRYYEAPINRRAPPPPVHSQATVFNDYFNEDNTSGCGIM